MRQQNKIAQRNLIVSDKPLKEDTGPVVTLRTTVLRPDDLLNLQVEGLNLELNTDDPAKPVLVSIDAKQPALLIVQFPPQSAAEEAFVEQSGYQPLGVEEPDKKRLDNPGRPSMSVKPAGEKIAARIGGPTRLVFRVPNDARIPFTTESLLDWSKFELIVAPIADVAPNAKAPDSALTIRPPEATETTLELPYRLHLSPTHDVVWDHARHVVSHGGHAELWHTRLATLKPDGAIQSMDVDHTLPLRAIWSPDYNPSQMPSPGDFGPIGTLSAMSPYDRHQIVVLTSAFRGYAANPFLLYVPEPIQASLLMLSPLGGWLRSFGIWAPPYKIKPQARFDEWKWEDLFRIQRISLDVNAESAKAETLDMVERPINAIANLELLTEIDAGDFLFPITVYDTDYQLDLSQWAHIAAQGRDHYVRIVYEGKLKWTGHAASLVKVTERRFEEDPKTKAPVAYLRQYMYIVVREPEKDYSQEGLEHDGRGMPLRKIRLTTLVTPKIDYPYNPPSAITDRSFWVMVGGKDFLFHAISEDVAGNKIDFTMPLIFVPNSEQNFQKIHDHFNLPENIKRRAATVPGQKVTFATIVGGNDNTNFVTQALNFENEGVSQANFFKPKLFKADVRIPAVEQLVGSDASTEIRLFENYLNGGFNDPNNATGVFAEIVKENASGLLENTSLGVEFAAQQAGGFATPNLGITNLSRNLGPLGGKIDDALKNEFDPTEVFKKGLAKLFGTFDLADLLPTGKADKDAPKMQVRREGTTVIAELDWRPKVNHLDLQIIEFNKNDDTQLIVHGVFKKNLAAPTNDEFTLNGDLNHFNILFFKVMQINFALFSFKSQSGKKTDVNVKLDDNLPVEFKGDLEFVEGLRKLIPPGVFGDGVSVDLIKNPLGVKAGLAITLPPVSVGVFALQNISLSAGLTVPFLDGKPIVDFGFARRDNPFLLTVSLLGGGGFFHIELETAGIRMLEAAFEFGTVAALDIGVASGEVHIMAGIYFKMEKKVVPELGNKEVMVSLLTGYLRCGGKLSVLGLVSISVEFYLCFTYNSTTQKASGRATLTVTIEIAFFSKSIELTVERSFGGQGDDPTFADLMNSPEVWNEYASAFA
jgi:hypothetical protein